MACGRICEIKMCKLADFAEYNSLKKPLIQYYCNMSDDKAKRIYCNNYTVNFHYSKILSISFVCQNIHVPMFSIL